MASWARRWAGRSHRHEEPRPPAQRRLPANLIAKGNGFPDPRTNMLGFGDKLSTQDIAEVVALIKSLWTPEQRAFQEALNQR